MVGADLHANRLDLAGLQVHDGHTLSGMVHMLLRVIGGHRGRYPALSSLTEITLMGLHATAEDFIGLLEGPYLKAFAMVFCNIATGSFGSDAEAVHEVARRFSLHPTLQSLVLDIHPLNEAYFCAVLNALQTNTRIEKLTLCHSADLGTPLSATASDAMVRLFQTSICLRLRVIQFVWFTWTGDSLAALAQSLRTSPMQIKEICFEHCRLDDASCTHLGSMFRRAPLPPYSLTLHSTY
jgi:hypothetical protein